MDDQTRSPASPVEQSFLLKPQLSKERKTFCLDFFLLKSVN